MLTQPVDTPLLPMADVMREVTIYDTIEPQANYSAKVHALATFHASGRLDEIDDPLYGSTDRGGAEEVAAVTAAATVLASCCEARADAVLHGSMMPCAHAASRALSVSARRGWRTPLRLRPSRRAWPRARRRPRLRDLGDCAHEQQRFWTARD